MKHIIIPCIKNMFDNIFIISTFNENVFLISIFWIIGDESKY